MDTGNYYGTSSEDLHTEQQCRSFTCLWEVVALP